MLSTFFLLKKTKLGLLHAIKKGAQGPLDYAVNFSKLAKILVLAG